MGFSTPFLYLPDAVSLTLVLIGLTLLRQSVVEHLRQEFIRIRKEIRTYWPGTGLQDDDPARVGLERELDSLIELAPKLSPARLYFVLRRFRETSRGSRAPQSDPLSQLARRIGSIQDARVRDRMARFQREVLLSLGVFFFIASLSGWLLFLCVAFRRLLFSHRSGNRIDWAMEFIEKLVYRIGRRAHRLVLLTTNCAN